MPKQNETFHRELWQIALPVTLQCLLHSSFGVVDQIMVGQLGTVSVAGIGLASRFGMMYNVALNGIAAAAGIMIAQYVGQRSRRGVSRSFFLNLLLAAGLAVLFAAGCMTFSRQVMSLYTTDPATKEVAASYLRICALGFLPCAATQLMAALLRCTGAARLPLYATSVAAVLNTILNYTLIFGRFGLPALGANGAAWGSVLAQSGGCLLIFVLGVIHCRKQGFRLELTLRMEKAAFRQYLAILLPALGCEVLWGLGENAYAAIYGRMGTAECAAMTLINPMVMILVGSLAGLSSAAGVLIGKRLGEADYAAAYRESKRLLLYGLVGSVILGLMMAGASGWYVRIYQVEPEVRRLTAQLLCVFALLAPVKMLNMILGNGILRSGGKTNYIMGINAIGTWCVGVPVGALAAFVWGLPITWVYFLLSLEEGVRLLLELALFRSRKWVQTLA